MRGLKPCPFCGGTVVSIEKMAPRLYRPDKKFSVVCWQCDLFFGYDEDYGGMFDTEAKAIEAWNGRANDERICENQAQIV